MSLSRIASFRHLAMTAVAGSLLILSGAAAPGEIYQVGPEREFKSMAEVADRLGPGDRVEVDGGHAYAGTVTFDRHGTGEAPIVIRGLRAGGGRPLLVPPGPQLIGALVRFNGDHYRFEGFEMTGGSSKQLMRAIYNVAHDVTVSDVLIRDCPLNGIAGSDRSGSFTLEDVEIRNCGHRSLSHSIYVGSDHSRYPDALFTMRFCYIHDGTGGNLVKSRAARTRIEYCRIERAAFFELDLIGGDPGSQDPQANADVKESAEIYGCLITSRPGSRGAIARLGSDGTGASEGTYRFAFNTFVQERSDGPILQVRGPIKGIRFFNNAVVRTEGRGPFCTALFGSRRSSELSGGGNWFSGLIERVPDALGVVSDDRSPALEATPTYRPVAASPLRDAAIPLPEAETADSKGPFDPIPPFEPVGTDGARQARTLVDAPDIGAFEGR